MRSHYSDEHNMTLYRYENHKSHIPIKIHFNIILTFTHYFYHSHSP
jgi:hypothetical protein